MNKAEWVYLIPRHIPGEPLATTEIIGIILLAIVGVGASVILAREMCIFVRDRIDKKRRLKYRRSIDDVERTHRASQ